MTDDGISDELLASLPADGRRVVRLMAQGGWATGRPSLAAVERTCDTLGLTFGDEQNRGEARAFWPVRGQGPIWRRLAARLDTVKPAKRSTPEAISTRRSRKPSPSEIATLADAIRDAVLLDGRLTAKEADRGADAARALLLSRLESAEFCDRLDAAVYAGVTSSGFRTDRSAKAVTELLRSVLTEA